MNIFRKLMIRKIIINIYIAPVLFSAKNLKLTFIAFYWVTSCVQENQDKPCFSSTLQCHHIHDGSGNTWWSSQDFHVESKSTKNRKKKRWIMMKNDSCTLKIGPTYFLSLQRKLRERHFHYWPQKEEELHFFQTNEKNIIMDKKNENTTSLLLNFHKTAINNIVVGYKYIGGKDGAVVSAPPMWPGFESKPWHQMWVEFVVGSLRCFYSKYSCFPTS